MTRRRVLVAMLLSFSLISAPSFAVVQAGAKCTKAGALLISVFDDAYNYMKNGTLLRQVINKINQDIDYNSVETRHLFGDIYEQILRDLQNAGNAGEYYTPRAVTQFAIEMVNPQLGEIVLDPACGTGGFLTGAFEHMKKQVKKPAELKELKNSIRGVEKKPPTISPRTMAVPSIAECILGLATMAKTFETGASITILAPTSHLIPESTMSARIGGVKQC